MKRSWFGLVLLLVLLASGLLGARGMERIHEPVARDLITAGEYALRGDWEQAESYARRARDCWEEHEILRACFADHGPMEEVDACFAMLEIYCRMKEETAFAAACGETARKAQAMGQAHGLRLENLF